jgi:hypothetical protein
MERPDPAVKQVRLMAGVEDFEGVPRPSGGQRELGHRLGEWPEPVGPGAELQEPVDLSGRPSDLPGAHPEQG